jgi:bifunctional DNase/RNase
MGDKACLLDTHLAALLASRRPPQEPTMIEVSIDSIRVSLLSQNRIVVLREEKSDRFLPIWIGPFEADAITLQLQGMEAPRPLTHDLLKSVIETLGASVEHIFIHSLSHNTYYAKIVLDANGDTIEIDSRPSDAIALAVRVSAPIYVSDDVMESAGMLPEQEMVLGDEGSGGKPALPARAEGGEVANEDLGAFKDLIEGLDLDSLLGN